MHNALCTFVMGEHQDCTRRTFSNEPANAEKPIISPVSLVSFRSRTHQHIRCVLHHTLHQFVAVFNDFQHIHSRSFEIRHLQNSS